MTDQPQPPATGLRGLLRRRAGRIAASVLVTAGFLALAWLLLDLTAVWAALARLDLRLLPWAGAAALAVVPLRWLRLAVATQRRPDLALLRATALHGGAVAVLPAKLGELVLPLALNRMTEISLAEALGLLFVIRLYDLMALMVLGACALALTAEPLGLAWLRWPAAAAALAAAVVMLTLPVLARLVRAALGAWLRRWQRADDITQRVSVGMTRLGIGQIAALIVLSTLIWCAIFAVFHVAAVASGGAAGVPTSAVAGTAGALAFALPVNGLANVGPFETAWAAVMARAGIDTEVAIAGALAAHAVTIAVNVAAAAGALLVAGGER